MRIINITACITNKPGEKSFNNWSIFEFNVLNKTKNNLHKLKSLVCFIDLYDEIVITESKDFSIKIKGPFKNFIKKNIIEKTFIIFSKFSGLKTNYKILLNKKIPVAAGLGGGSADAAAILQGLNFLNKKKIKKKDLFKLGMEIGSDVPACLYNKNVFFSGYGQILSKAPKVPPVSVLLINPCKELSTKKVFLEYDKNFLFNKKNNTHRLNNKNFYSWILKNNNDLLMPAKKIVPEIGEMLSFLDNLENCLLDCKKNNLI